MSKKTWHVIPPRDEARAFNIIEFIDDDFGTHIAEVYDEDSVKLIAAAPEMYEMLKVLLQKIGKNFAVIDFGSPLVPTSKELHSDMKVWEAKSFFDFREIKELLARIDGEEVQE